MHVMLKEIDSPDNIAGKLMVACLQWWRMACMPSLHALRLILSQTSWLVACMRHALPSNGAHGMT